MVPACSSGTFDNTYRTSTLECQAGGIGHNSDDTLPCQGIHTEG